MDTAERRALAGMWSIRGIGPQTIDEVRRLYGPLAGLLERPVRDWAGAAPLTPQARESLAGVACLAAAADRLERVMRKTDQRAIFPGDAAFPPLLEGLTPAPPLLFLRGPGAEAPHRPRVAMVGTRHPDGGYAARARQLACRMAEAGLGVVSGAAIGIDTACHEGALQGGGETWAFMGAGLDQLDAPQARLWPAFRAGLGSFFSQFPPGARGDTSTFPQRNRYISGAADVVLIVRAPRISGALQTAKHALDQGRALLAVPGDHDLEAAVGGNLLLREGKAQICLGPAEVLAALGLPRSKAQAGPAPGVEVGPLPPGAAPVIEALARGPLDFDLLLTEAGGCSPGQLRHLLMQLELGGRVVRAAGSRWAAVGRLAASDVDASGVGH